jgi:predicted DNA-binding ribbon-helix-helix protein
LNQSHNHLNQFESIDVIRKHSASLHGHRTSISLEDEFWLALKEIASARDMSFAGLLAEIDDRREAGSNLSSALRVYVLNWLKSQTQSAVLPQQD